MTTRVQKKGYLGKVPQHNEFIFTEILKSGVLTNWDSMHLHIPKTKMVRMLHMNHCREISLQISDSKIEFLTNTLCFLRNKINVQTFERLFFGEKKVPGTPLLSRNLVLCIFRNVPESTRTIFYLNMYMCI